MASVACVSTASDASVTSAARSVADLSATTKKPRYHRVTRHYRPPLTVVHPSVSCSETGTDAPRNQNCQLYNCTESAFAKLTLPQFARSQLRCIYAAAKSVNGSVLNSQSDRSRAISSNTRPFFSSFYVQAILILSFS